PTLIASNPHIRELVASGQKLSKREEMKEYKRIVQTMSPLVGDAGVSIEVFADQNTTAQEMIDQGRDMFSWISNAYIKYPCTVQGLRAAQMSITQGIRVNITLCFSQQQAAAVYSATKGTKQRVYVSPFVGRLDDIGKNGMDVVKNIKQMFLNKRWPCSRNGREHPQPRAPALLLCTRHRACDCTRKNFGAVGQPEL